jgi:Protein of unknown function (DUF2630)
VPRKATVDASVLARIERKVAEEHRLLGKGQLSAAESRRLADVQLALDRYWDLLRQRRALRETGSDPSQAQLRPTEVVERYLA